MVEGDRPSSNPNVEERRDQAAYHAILSDLHRVQSAILSLQTLDSPHTAESLRDYFTRERSIALGRLREWEQRRPDVYRLAGEAFRREGRFPADDDND
ncbi:MAG TPA: hypothetical protein VFB58_10240 [Chloroflexota bacterium]|nr:hypothetical protein [Chloroflexota bacterium]